MSSAPSRRVTLGQATTFRRVHFPIVCSASDRPRLKKPRRGAAKLNTLVTTRQQSEREALQAAPLDEAYIEEDSEASVETLPAKTFNFEDPAETESAAEAGSEIAEAVSDLEGEMERDRNGDLKSGAEKKSEVLVVKKPSGLKRPSAVRPPRASMQSAEKMSPELDREVSQRVIIAKREKEAEPKPPGLFEASTVPAEKPKPKVLVAKRPAMKPQKVKPDPTSEVLKIPVDSVVRREGDVLVIKKSAVKADPTSMPESELTVEAVMEQPVIQPKEMPQTSFLQGRENVNVERLLQEPVVEADSAPEQVSNFGEPLSQLIQSTEETPESVPVIEQPKLSALPRVRRVDDVLVVEKARSKPVAKPDMKKEAKDVSAISRPLKTSMRQDASRKREAQVIERPRPKPIAREAAAVSVVKEESPIDTPAELPPDENATDQPTATQGSVLDTVSDLPAEEKQPLKQTEAQAFSLPLVNSPKPDIQSPPQRKAPALDALGRLEPMRSAEELEQEASHSAEELEPYVSFSEGLMSRIQSDQKPVKHPLLSDQEPVSKPAAETAPSVSSALKEICESLGTTVPDMPLDKKHPASDEAGEGEKKPIAPFSSSLGTSSVAPGLKKPSVRGNNFSSTNSINDELRSALNEKREKQAKDDASPPQDLQKPVYQPPAKRTSPDLPESLGLRGIKPPVGPVSPRNGLGNLKAPPKLMHGPSKMKAQAPEERPEVVLDRQLLREKLQTRRDQDRQWIQDLREQRAKIKAEKQAQRQIQRKKNDPMVIEMRRKARQERQTRRRGAYEDAEREMIIEVGAEGLSVEALAELLAMDPSDVIKILFVKGVMVTVNQTLDMDTVKVVAAEMNVDVVDKDEAAVTDMAKKEGSFCEDDEAAIDRPPVVTVMGHVDHGKTSLLDCIRDTSVVAGEAGGITQAIGAYTCSLEVEGEDRTICFLDTPGHEAFSAMRARGARVTDIAVVVIAADDGIRPQTLEAINHAKAAQVPIVVAINKIDVPGADPERVKRELSEIEMLPEEWGGQTPVIEISAKTGDGVGNLLELLTLVADIQLDLKANPEAPAKGTVIEAYMDKRSGVMATVLIQNGTLHVGDAIVSGGAFGKVRSLTDAAGNQVDDAGPSIAVRMLGLHEIPVAGDVFSVCQDETEAKEEAEKGAVAIRQRHLAEAAGGGSMVTLSSLASVDEDDTAVLQRINLVLKADTSGSLEAVKGALAKLPQDSVMIRYLHMAPGEVTESDVLLAATAGGMIVGFNAPISEGIKSIAKQKGVELLSYSVIYTLIDDVRRAMEGRLHPTEDRLSIGEAEVRAVFGAGSRRVAGCMVTEGRLEKDCLIKVMRKKECVFEGMLSSLRRVKDNVNEAAAGLECGVGCDAFSDWQERDRIEAFTLVQKRLTLEESHATMAVNEEELQQLIG